MLIVKQCSKCGNPRDREPQRYCKACHASYMRQYRPKHSDLPPEARMRANTRSYANSYLRRGMIERQPCFSCGSERSQMHHPDYSKPLEVVWLCRECHLDLHHDREKTPVESENALP